MKKYKLVLILLLIVGVFSLTGCKKKEEKHEYNKEVEIHSIESINSVKRLSFELAKDLGYNPVISGDTARFRHPSNYSMIEVQLVRNYRYSSIITKKEEDFYSDYYHDYKQVKVGNYEGWSIYKTTELLTDYQMNLILTSEDQENKVYALIIKVTQSPLQKDPNSFNTTDFVNSDDFQHLLNTISVVDIE